MFVSIIAAVSQNGVIGRDGSLPWYLQPDLKRFKQLTMGFHIVMGRRTFESIGVLPGRISIVVTRNSYPDVITVRGLDEAIQLAAPAEELFVIGGAQLYRAALPIANRLYLTWIDAYVDGDTFFPPWEPSDWSLVSETQHEADYPYRYQIWESMH